MASLKTLTDRGQLLREVTSFPSGVTNDGVNGFTIDSKNWVRVKRSGAFKSEEIGIWADGTDMTSKINSRLAHSLIKTIVFDSNGGGDILVSGAITVPAGKVLKFVNGTKLTGAGTITNANIDVAKGVYFAATTLTFVNAIALNGAFTPENRGAVGNGTADDTAAMQAAFNMSVRTNGGVVDLMPNRTYKITTPVVIPQFTLGQIPHFRINGNNANITVTGGIVAFTKAVSTQTEADAQVNSRVHLHHLRFVGDGSAGSGALKLHCTYGSILENCGFINFDTAVEFRFCLNPIIKHNFFQNSTTTDVYLGSGNWTGASGSNSQSNQAEFSHNRHYCKAGQLSALEIINASNVLIADCIFEGGNPVKNINFNAIGSTTVRQVYIERPHIENAPTDCSIYLTAQGGMYFIREIWAQIAHVFVKQGQFVGNSDIVIDGTNHHPSWTGAFAVETAYAGTVNWSLRNYMTFGSYGSGLTATLAALFVQTAGYSVPTYKYLATLNGSSTYTATDSLTVPGVFLSRKSDGFNNFYTAVTMNSDLTAQGHIYRSVNKYFYFHNGTSPTAQSFGATTTHTEWRTTTKLGVRVTDAGGIAIGGTWSTYVPLTDVDFGNCTASIGLPKGTTAQRDASPSAGFLRYNSTLVAIEGYVGGSWVNITSPAWTQLSGVPTTLAGYGITDGVSISGSYSNPLWLTSLAWSKITSTPTTLAGYGITNGVSITGTETITNKTLGTGTKINLGTVALGDIYYGDASGNLVRLAPGAAGTVLTINSGIPSWAAPAGGGGTSSETFAQPVDTNYTIPAGTDNYHVIYNAAITASRTVTLSATTGRIFTIRHGGLGAFLINFSTPININATNQVSTLAQGESITFYYDGANYVVIK